MRKHWYCSETQRVGMDRRKIMMAAGAAIVTMKWTPVHSQTSEPTSPDDPLALPGESQDAELAINRQKAEEILANVVGGRPLREGLIEAIAPDIAEDGSTVPVSFRVDCSMTNNDYPKTVHVIGMVNPTPEIARYHFTNACGEAAVVFRCRMHASSKLSFVADMADGTVGMTQRFVTVTAGGCI